MQPAGLSRVAHIWIGLKPSHDPDSKPGLKTSLATQSVVPKTAASVIPGSFLEIQISGPHP